MNSYYKSNGYSYYMPVACDKSYVIPVSYYYLSYYPFVHSYGSEAKNESSVAAGSYYTKFSYSAVSSYDFLSYKPGWSYFVSYCTPPAANRCDNELSYKTKSYNIVHKSPFSYKLKSYNSKEKSQYVYYGSYFPSSSYMNDNNGTNEVSYYNPSTYLTTAYSIYSKQYTSYSPYHKYYECPKIYDEISYTPSISYSVNNSISYEASSYKY